MALPSVGVMTRSFVAVNWNTTGNVTFALYFALSTPIFNGGKYDGELSGDASFETAPVAGFQTDLTNQLVAYLNTRYGIALTSANVVWVT